MLAYWQTCWYFNIDSNIVNKKMDKKQFFLAALSIAFPLPREMTTVYLTGASNVHHFLQIFQVFDITNLTDSRFLRFCALFDLLVLARLYGLSPLITATMAPCKAKKKG